MLFSPPPPPDDPPPPSPLRRFIDANLYDWGRTGDDVDVDPSGMGSGGSYNKPGIMVKRDDEVGYMIIDKPPNVPVHVRVDNTLKNVASCMGSMLWMERWGGSNLMTTMLSSSSSDEECGVEIDSGNSCADDDGRTA